MADQVWLDAAPESEIRLNQCTAVVDLISNHFPADYPIKAIQHSIVPAVLTGQVKIAYSSDNNIIGLISWSFLSKDTHDEFIYRRVRMLDITEWNDGLRLWIMRVTTGVDLSLISAARVIRELVARHKIAYFVILRKERFFLYSIFRSSGRIVLRKREL